VISREAVSARDEADPLAGFRERFVLTDSDRIYLDGNSLGRLPIPTRDRLRDLADEWGDRLVSGWADWIDAPTRVGDLLAAAVLGARPGEVVVGDSTTVNLYKLAGAVIAARSPRALVVDRDEFPTDRYVVGGLASAHGLALAERAGEPPLERGDLVVLSHVSYRSGALRDLAALQARADANGATIIWDLSHSAGALPIELAAGGAELAVGCTYKYLNAGPGAPGYLYVRADAQDGLISPIQGWFGQAGQFAMERPYEPQPGIRRFLAGTPPVIGLAAVEAGARLIARAGVAALHAKAVALTTLVVDLHDAWLAPLGFAVATPRDPARRGSHVALTHPQAWQLTRALIERAGVIPDFRGPDTVRLGLAPLYTRHADVWDALDRLRAIAESGEHEAYDPTPGRVT